MKAQKEGTFGQRLIESAREAVQIERGERPAARITKYTAAEAKVEPPPRYVSDRIREIRAHMMLSQPVFAAALNVSTETVRAWEQGKREPDGAALRLLEIAEQHPGVFLKKVQVSSVRAWPAEPSESPMSSEKDQLPEPEMRDEYDFHEGVRGKYASRFAEGSNVIALDPDVAEVFGDAKAVNEALRLLARSARESQRAS